MFARSLATFTRGRGQVICRMTPGGGRARDGGKQPAEMSDVLCWCGLMRLLLLMKVMCAGVCATEAGDAGIRMHGVNGGTVQVYTD